MIRRSLSILAVAAACAAAAGCASADGAATSASTCPANPEIAPTVARWKARQAIPALPITSSGSAVCFRRGFLAQLEPQLGKLVGYKVGLFSQAARTAYKTDQPRLGFLYDKMLVADGATVPAAYGAAGTWESDLLLVVKDGGINTAKSREEIYSHLRGYKPFIELPDRNYAPEVAVTADQVEALNVGARMGVVGEEVALPQTPAGMAGLVNFIVDVTVAGPEGPGPRTEHGKALDSLGDVIEIVRFARDRILTEGRKLKAGDIISIGVVTPARAPKPGQTVTIRYSIVAQPSTVSVNFR